MGTLSGSIMPSIKPIAMKIPLRRREFLMEVKLSHVVGLTLAITIALPIASARSQSVQPDNRLGTIVTPNAGTYTITGGRSLSSNLFHSFSAFSLLNTEKAIFDLIGQTGVTSIFNRVTGGSISTIDGMIKTMNTSNPVSVFLMNPNGIVFGPNARLDVTGSFVGTTATGIQFADGSQFTADTSADASLLRVSLPIGLRMGSNSGDIAVQGGGHTLTTILPRAIPVPIIRDPTNTGLALTSGKTLALIGRNVGLTGGILMAEQGQIELKAVQSGIIGLNLQPDQNLYFNDAPANTPTNTYGEIRLDNRSLLDVSGVQGGAIHLQGQNLNFTSGSMVLNQNYGPQTAGTIRLDAIDRIHLQDATPITQTSIFSESLGSGQGGMLEINAKQLTLDTGAVVGSSSYGNGRSGLLEIKVSEKIQIRGFAPSAPFIISGIGNSTYGQGLGSVTRLKTQRLEILDGGSLSASVLGMNRGSDMTVDARDILVSGLNPLLQLPSAIGTTVFGTGSGGNLTIQSDRMVLRDGSIGSSTLSKGSAGNLTINATQSIEVNGGLSTISSAAARLNELFQNLFGLPAIPTGNSGDLKVTTPQLRVLNGGGISVYSDGPGSAGNLMVVADSIFLNQAATITASTVSGNGGDIRLGVGSAVILRNGSLIATSSQGTGNGGSLFINSPSITGLENSDITANAITGNGGKIQITTQGIFGLKYRDRLTASNDITVSSDVGTKGTVQINNFGLTPQVQLPNLSQSLADRQQITNQCQDMNQSQFISTGRGGIPTSPTNRLKFGRNWNDLRAMDLDRSPSIQVTTTQTITPPMEATAIARLQDGSLALVGQDTPDRDVAVTCGVSSHE